LSQGLTSWVSARLHANVIERLRMIYSTVGLYGVIKYSTKWHLKVFESPKTQSNQTEYSRDKDS
jgi:hypothetical protein